MGGYNINRELFDPLDRLLSGSQELTRSNQPWPLMSKSKDRLLNLMTKSRLWARNVKVKDQTYQESSVKIELMERRLEVIKRQVETILELENKHASSAKKDTKKFHEDMELLQVELGMPSRWPWLPVSRIRVGPLPIFTMFIEPLAIGVQPAESENLPIESNLESSHPLEQVRFRTYCSRCFY